MSGTRTRSRKDDGEDSGNDANVTAVIYPKILNACVTTLTGAITTTVSKATTARTVSFNENNNSYEINPYDSKSMDLSTKEGKYQ